MSRGPLRGDGLRPPVLTDSLLTSSPPAWLFRNEDRLTPVCPPLAGHSTPGRGANVRGRGAVRRPSWAVAHALGRSRAATRYSARDRPHTPNAPDRNATNLPPGGRFVTS